jgi:hypothetical protein
VHLLPYGISALFGAILVAYAIWFRPVVLDIPVALRLALSVLPGYVFYRAASTLYMLFIYRASPYFRGSLPNPTRFVGYAIMLTGFGALVLYHIWRDVKLDDFGRRNHPEMVGFLRPSEPRSPAKTESLDGD